MIKTGQGIHVQTVNTCFKEYMYKQLTPALRPMLELWLVKALLKYRFIVRNAAKCINNFLKYFILFYFIYVLNMHGISDV